VYGFLSPQWRYSWRTFQQYGPILLLLLLFFGARILGLLVFGPACTISTALIGTCRF
jgi:hypothetical protein